MSKKSLIFDYYLNFYLKNLVSTFQPSSLKVNMISRFIPKNWLRLSAIFPAVRFTRTALSIWRVSWSKTWSLMTRERLKQWWRSRSTDSSKKTRARKRFEKNNFLIKFWMFRLETRILLKKIFRKRVSHWTLAAEKMVELTREHMMDTMIWKIWCKCNSCSSKHHESIRPENRLIEIQQIFKNSILKFHKSSISRPRSASLKLRLPRARS